MGFATIWDINPSLWEKQNIYLLNGAYVFIFHAMIKINKMHSYQVCACGIIKGTTHPKNRKYILIHRLLPVVLFIHLDNLLWVTELWRCLPSIQYNENRWHLYCGAQSAKKIHSKNSTMSFSKNHDPFTQENLQNLLWAVSWGNYFCSIDLHPPTISQCRRRRASIKGQEIKLQHSQGRQHYCLHPVLSGARASHPRVDALLPSAWRYSWHM